MSSDDQYLNELLADVKSSANNGVPKMIPLPSLEPPKQTRQLYEKNPYTGEVVPVMDTSRPRPDVPLSREPTPMEKIKMLGQMVAGTYQQAMQVESKHVSDLESYGSTDKGQRMAMMGGLQKMAVNLDKQSEAIKRGQNNVVLTNTNIEEIEPNVPQFVDINTPQGNTRIVSNSPNYIPQKPRTVVAPIKDDNQLELDFGDRSLEDVAKINEKIYSKILDLEYNIKEIIKRLDSLSEQISNNKSSKKKVN